MKNQLYKKILLEIPYVLYAIGTIIIYPILIALAIYLKVKRVRNKQSYKSISGQVAVITGSAGGLGRDLAIELAKNGCHVAIVDIQQELAKTTALYIAQKYQVKTNSYKVDVSDYQQLVELNENVNRDLGDITILINNAGILMPSSLKTPSAEDIQRMINVNFTAVCFSKEIFVPKMKTLNRGHVVNISSVAALLASPLFDVYAGTKAAVRSITSALRMEIKNESKNITVTTVMPMFLTTNQFVEYLMNLSGIEKILPLIDGSVAAQCIVESMLNNDNEVTLPKGVLYIYKLFELLPSSVKEFLMPLLISKQTEELVKSQNPKNFPKPSDRK